MFNSTVFCKEIGVKDPDTNAIVNLSVYKHENGGMFAIDSSFVNRLPKAFKGDDPRRIAMDPLSDPLADSKLTNFVILEEEK